MARALRYLRIAFNAVCFVCCVLFIVLWVRSYWRLDQLLKVAADGYSGIQSESGWVGVWWSDDPNLSLYGRTGWRLRTFDGPRFLPDEPPLTLILRPLKRVGDILQIPYWMVLVVTALVTAVPWFRWRFSLRTLLITTTLVAVGLGLIVYFCNGN